jgi:biotin-dependent carboxylase-like uncharacterized protein
MIEVFKPGRCDLVMDAGRPGWGALGMPIGGAADAWALAEANACVGNPAEAAGLELLLAGPVLHFPLGGIVALTGARFEAHRSSGAPVDWYSPVALAAGETLTLGKAQSGCRSWLAVQGGIAVPLLLGSRSTFLPSGFGGHEGRALKAGDVLACGRVNLPLETLRPASPAANLDKETPLRLVAGPQTGLFDDAGLAAFFGGRYRIGAASDRRGLRLHGLAVTCARTELASQGVLPGAVQVPPDGQPIILGWDGPVTGGYPVIGCVIRADHPRLAQLQPGDAVCFETVSVEQAQALAATETGGAR